MASGGAEEDDGGTALDIDNVHMLLQGQAIPVLDVMTCDVLESQQWPNHELNGGDTISA